MTETTSEAPLKVCVVGSGTRFLSGISYYTHRLSCELSERHAVSVILMRQLLPTRFYPGRRRVGKPLAKLDYPSSVPVVDGVDWHWFPTMLRAVALLMRERPQIVVFQWWTGTVLHSYLLLALVSRAVGARVVVEFHEVLDVGELRLAPARWYVRAFSPLLVRLSAGGVVHSDFDRRELRARYSFGRRPLELIPHGPYDQYGESPERSKAGPLELLYFGVIRPFKGVEDLIQAFDDLGGDVSDFRLTVVGETWEGWTLPAERIAKSRNRDRITFVNRYVTDEEVGAFLSAADAMVLPYHRSSSSGPLHLAMAHGLPIVVTAVGGLVEAVAGYEGAVQVPPHDPPAIRDGLVRVRTMRGRRFTDPHSWERTVARYEQLFLRMLGNAGRAAVEMNPQEDTVLR